ncbi:RsmF rRNA methyltransferase first C-terminal domain-containing protein [Neobacillus sp. SM06]|uniref:RsmF rRNA methyltransferase first C-terminal domain-containing protein n=1 Tax=Neobacillus sp. SM06 TaxID=3422492 RepID=UPI003D2A7314
MDLPKNFIVKFQQLLQQEAESFFRTYDDEKKSGLRINPLKITEQNWLDISPFSLEKIPFVPNGFYYDSVKDQPGKHPYHAAGLYYIQEPSAMFVAEQLAPKPGEKVLDLCAAPGGKTTQLAGMMNQEGFLLANEIHPKRAKALSENIERLGIEGSLVTNETPERLASHFPGYFDKILVDAPCSGEGMFRKDPDAVHYWSDEHVAACASQQKNILDSAYQMLNEGGILVYSTCTFSPEENEQTVEAFLKKYPDLQLLPIQKPDGVQNGKPEWGYEHNPELLKTARLWPHHLRGEGHFVAKFKKNAASETANIKNAVSTVAKSQMKDFQLFVETTIQKNHFANLFLFHQQLFALTENFPSFQGLKVLRAGLHLGEFKKNRFEPNHALAMSLKNQDVYHFYSLPSSELEWVPYLKGETISSGEDRGWILVTIDGYPLGWGKEVKGVIKNFYPKGLRIRGA